MVVWMALALSGCGSGPTKDRLPPADADTDTDSDADTDTDADTDSDTDTTPPPHPVAVTFTGTVSSVSGAPFGLDQSAWKAPVAGSFGYDASIPDSAASDAMRGIYDHLAGGGTFTLQGGGHTITGSGRPVASVELYGHVFHFVDGPQVGDDVAGVDRTCQVDGTADPAIEVSISFVPAGGFVPFTTDTLPDPFPYVGLVDGTAYLLTFFVGDEHGAVLVQLDSLSAAR